MFRISFFIAKSAVCHKLYLLFLKVYLSCHQFHRLCHLLCLWCHLALIWLCNVELINVFFAVQSYDGVRVLLTEIHSSKLISEFYQRSGGNFLPVSMGKFVQRVNLLSPRIILDTNGP